MNYMNEIREITTEEFNDLLNSSIDSDDYLPRGRFYYKMGEIYVAIDNMTGDAWVEEFDTLEGCLAWLAVDRSY